MPFFTTADLARFLDALGYWKLAQTKGKNLTDTQLEAINSKYDKLKTLLSPLLEEWKGFKTSLKTHPYQTLLKLNNNARFLGSPRPDFHHLVGKVIGYSTEIENPAFLAGTLAQSPLMSRFEKDAILSKIVWSIPRTETESFINAQLLKLDPQNLDNSNFSNLNINDSTVQTPYVGHIKHFLSMEDRSFKDLKIKALTLILAHENISMHEKKDSLERFTDNLNGYNQKDQEKIAQVLLDFGRMVINDTHVFNDEDKALIAKKLGFFIDKSTNKTPFVAPDLSNIMTQMVRPILAKEIIHPNTAEYITSTYFPQGRESIPNMDKAYLALALDSERNPTERVYAAKYAYKINPGHALILAPMIISLFDGISSNCADFKIRIADLLTQMGDEETAQKMYVQIANDGKIVSELRAQARLKISKMDAQ